MGNGTVLQPLSPTEVKGFMLAVGEQTPGWILESFPEFVRLCLRDKSVLGKIMGEALSKYVAQMPHDQALALWQRVYWEICGIEPRLHDIRLPDDPGGFGWPIVATPEVPLNRFWQGLKAKFPCQSVYGDDLEAALDWERQQRSYRDGAYCVRVHPNVEADEELKNLSANDLEERGGQYITEDERVRLEGFYWIISSGQHLDRVNITLCVGSRSSDGDVPRVRWRAGQLFVLWSRPGGADGALRARQVVPPAA